MHRLKAVFVHDVVCGWCYVLSPRLHLLAKELNLDVHHQCFTLQASREAMIGTFESMSDAKETILGHWENCAAAEDNPSINIEGMRAQTFEYPNGLPGALACKAAELQAGQLGHWRMFDRIQYAHLTENRNIGDGQVLRSLAEDTGLDMPSYDQDVLSETAQQAVEKDRQLAFESGVQSVPTMIVENRWLISGAQTTESLRRQFKEIRLRMGRGRLGI